MSQTLPFTKMQAVGNDFVVIEEAVWGADSDWADVAIRLCDRHKGVGGDGLLVVCPSVTADVRMRMFNPDGTEDMCGNGLRCVVRWAVQHGYLATTDEDSAGESSNPYELSGTVETLVGTRQVSASVRDREVGEIWTEMGVPAFHPTALPMAVSERDAILDYPLIVDGHGTVVVSSVNTGSTHTVIWVDDLPEDELFLGLSPKIEHHALYTDRTSVLWARKSLDRYGFDVRIWERGVGETLGCGTGACAVAVLAVRQGKIPPPYASSSSQADRPRSHHIRVHSRGGDLSVHSISTAGTESEPQHPALVLIGTAHTVYSGVIGKSPFAGTRSA